MRNYIDKRSEGTKSRKGHEEHEDKKNVTTQAGTKAQRHKGAKAQRGKGAKGQRHKERSLAANWQNNFVPVCLCPFVPA
jgi:hypothetical protein